VANIILLEYVMSASHRLLSQPDMEAASAAGNTLYAFRAGRASLLAGGLPLERRR
jgi:hypothetical protein